MARRAGIGVWLLAALLACAGAEAGNVFEGKRLYSKHCQSCHGVDGRGVMPGMPDFSRGEGLFATQEQLRAVIVGGKGVMPAFFKQFEDDQVDDVIAYLRTFL